MKRHLFAALLFFAAAVPSPTVAGTQSTAFTYQGRLLANGQAANGNYDLSFKLFDSNTVGTGTQIGSTISMLQFPVVNGTFTIDLNFPGAFTGNQVWLEVAVGAETLNVRQPVNSVPVAQYALKAAPAPVFLSSATNVILTTQVTGAANEVAVLPLSGHIDSAYSTSFVGGTVNLTPTGGATVPLPPQLLPTDGSIGSIRASLFLNLALAPFSEIFVTAQLYTNSAAGAVLSPVAGTSCTIPIVGVGSAGEELDCTLSGLSIPYVAGTKAAIVVAATTAAALPINVSGSMSVSIGP